MKSKAIKIFQYPNHIPEIESEPMGPYLNAYIATFAAWFEGIFSGFMMTFILINFLTNQKE